MNRIRLWLRVWRWKRLFRWYIGEVGRYGRDEAILHTIRPDLRVAREKISTELVAIAEADKQIQQEEST